MNNLASGEDYWGLTSKEFKMSEHDDLDRLYDEMMDDFFMITCDADKESFIQRYTLETYEKIMSIYLNKGIKND